MKKVKVVNIEDKYVLTLEDTDEKRYRRNIEFYDIDINVGDYIYISDQILEEDNLYTYGPIEDKTDVEDLIKIVKEDKEIYLQRYYG